MERRGNSGAWGLMRADGGSPVEGSPVPAIVGVAGGILLLSLIPFFGALLLAFSLRLLMWEGRRHRVILSLAPVLVGFTVLALLDAPGAAMVVSPALIALAVTASMARGKADTLMVSLAVVAGSLVAFLIDAALAAAAGTTVREVLSGAFQAVMQASLGTGIEEGLALDQSVALFNVLWPFMYVMQSAVYAVAAGAGSWLAEARFSARPAPSLASYDAPLWAVGVLAASILLVGASFTGVPAADALRCAGATLLMSVRFIFMLEGFGVVSARFAQGRMGCAFRAIVVFVLIWVETVFMAVSIVGLIDVWANFRKLPREGSRTS